MTTKKLLFIGEIEGIGNLMINYTASHRNGEGDSHPDGPKVTTDEFTVESIDGVSMAIEHVESMFPPIHHFLEKRLIKVLEETLSENPYLFFDEEIPSNLPRVMEHQVPNGQKFPVYVKSRSAHLFYKVINEKEAFEIGTDHFAAVSANRAYYGGFIPSTSKEVDDAFRKFKLKQANYF